jgi:hypothetical protein
MTIQTRRLASNLNIQHVLTWSFMQFKKTFPTPVSGLPELLFDEGFRTYKPFCIQAESSYANAITDLTPNEIRPSNNIPDDSQDLSFSSFDESDNDDDAINILFVLSKHVILKDCKGLTWEVTYLGPQKSGGIFQHNN